MHPCRSLNSNMWSLSYEAHLSISKIFAELFAKLLDTRLTTTAAHATHAAITNNNTPGSL